MSLGVQPVHSRPAERRTIARCRGCRQFCVFPLWRKYLRFLVEQQAAIPYPILVHPVVKMMECRPSHIGRLWVQFLGLTIFFWSNFGEKVSTRHNCLRKREKYSSDGVYRSQFQRWRAKGTACPHRGISLPVFGPAGGPDQIDDLILCGKIHLPRWVRCRFSCRVKAYWYSFFLRKERYY